MNFWDIHGTLWGMIFLLGMAIFPRITMLFGMLTPFGWLAWLGWLIAPHFAVAIFATSMYWHTNPVLCVFAWMFALAGTGGETKTARSATIRLTASRSRESLGSGYPEGTYTSRDRDRISRY